MTQLHSQNGSAGRCRRGFTLVELMVAIAIVAIIATFILSAMYAAQEAARERRTQVLINKIHQQLMLRWEDYAYRRVPIDAIALAEDTSGATPLSGSMIDTVAGMNNMRAIQLGAKRELMRMEMPDCFSDIFFDPTFLVNTAGDSLPNSFWSAYRAKITAAMPSGFDPNGSDQVVVANNVSDTLGDDNESAECLYLILTTMATGDSVFTERDVADTDGNGLPEFVDGWGRPIQWIRWPAGFFSDLQPGDPNSGEPATGVRIVAEDRDPDDPWLVDRDMYNAGIYAPAEPAYVDARGYRLTPLVVSAGRDGVYGLAFRWKKDPPILGSDPYAVIGGGSILPYAQRGRVQNQPGESAHLDNIHNHLLSGLE